MSAFYNRVQETQAIIQCIDHNEQNQNNKIILIVGKSGVGKSGLIRKILDCDLASCFSIQIRISKISPNTIENLHYINSIYREFCQQAKKKFFDDTPSPIQHGILSFKNLLRFGIEVIWLKISGGDKKFFEPVEEESVLRKKDYIINFLTHKPYIIDIENIQNIDTQSLEILKDIIEHVLHTTFIFEYTIDEEHTSKHFYSLYNELSNLKAEVSSFDIKELEFNEARKLAPEGMSEQSIRNIYLNSDGNLLKIILSSTLMSTNDDPIQMRISCISKDERFILLLLYLNGNEMQCYILYDMLCGNEFAPQLSQPSIEEIINSLLRQHLIEQQHDGRIRIYHDSIVSILEMQDITPMQYVAYNVLKSYYSAKLKCTPDEDAIEHLFHLYLEFSDDELLNIFPYLRQIIINIKYPKPSIDKLVHFREALTHKPNLNYKILYKMTLMLVSLCLELEFGDEAQRNLDTIYSKADPYHRMLQAAIYALDYTKLNNITELIQSAESDQERLIIQIYQLSGEMAKLPGAKSAEKAKKLIENKVYQSIFEYAYLLRNYAELVQNYDESIRLYYSAYKRFQKAKRKDLCAQVFVSLSMIYAYKGDLVIAKKLLNRADESNCIQERYLLNNWAVLEILSESTNEETIKQLKDSLLITADPYEQLIIECNLLVCYTLLNHQEQAAKLCEIIESQNYIRFQYEEFLHIVYQNLHYYYSTRNDSDKVKKYNAYLKSLINNASPGSMIQRLAPLQLDNVVDTSEFFSNFPFRVDFLGYWGLEISHDFEHSE